MFFVGPLRAHSLNSSEDSKGTSAPTNGLGAMVASIKRYRQR